MSFISYAQNYEDVRLFRVLGHIKKGFYIDAGAFDPEVDSVTRVFYDRGWRGINIEPVVQWHEKLVAERVRDINLQAAIAEKSGMLRLFEIVDTGLTTVNKDIAKKHTEDGFVSRTIHVPCLSLDEVLKAHPKKIIHFLKIDVEGAEKQVLASIDLARHRPWIILVEATEPNSTIPSHSEWEHLLTERQYRFVCFDGLNRFYVAEEKSKLAEPLALSPNYFDNFIRYAEWKTQRRLEELTSRTGALESGLAAKRQKAERLAAKLNEAVETKTQIESRVHVLSDELAVSHQRVEEFSLRTEKTENDLGAERQKSERLAAELNEAVTEKDRFATRIHFLKKELDVAKCRVEELASRQDKMENELGMERQKMESLSRELNQAVESKIRFESRVQTLANELKSTHQRTEELTARAKQLENDLAAEREKTESLPRELNQAVESKIRFESRVQTLANELKSTHQRTEELTAHAKQLESDLASERNKADRAHSEILKKTETALQAQAYSQSLQKDLELESQKARALREQVGQLEEVLQAGREQRAGVEAQLNETRQERDHLQEHSQWLQNEWDTAKQKVDELNHTSHHWWTVADQLNKDLQAIFASRSMRITRPLRKTADTLRAIKRGIARSFLWLAALPKRLVRGLVVRAMAFVLKRNTLRLKALSVVNKLPTIKMRLRNLAQARNMIPAYFEGEKPFHDTSQAQEPSISQSNDSMSSEFLHSDAGLNGASPSDVELEHLSPRAREIYFDLKAAIEAHKKENG